MDMLVMSYVSSLHFIWENQKEDLRFYGDPLFDMWLPMQGKLMTPRQKIAEVISFLNQTV
jgi:hypothetical protein